MLLFADICVVSSLINGIAMDIPVNGFLFDIDLGEGLLGIKVFSAFGAIAT